MDEGLILETTFLIDLERELRREEQGPVQTFLTEHMPRPASTLPSPSPANWRRARA